MEANCDNKPVKRLVEESLSVKACKKAKTEEAISQSDSDEVEELENEDAENANKDNESVLSEFVEQSEILDNESVSTELVEHSENLDKSTNIEEDSSDGEGKEISDNDEAEENEDELTSDPFYQHFEYVLPEECTEAATIPQNQRIKYDMTKEWYIPGLGDMRFYKMFSSREDPPMDKKSITEFPLKKSLLSNVVGQDFTQAELSALNILTNYLDLIYCQYNFNMRQQLRKAYSIHLVNHILKSTAKIIHHNGKLKKNPDAEFRDQGFTRPTVLILAPFKGDCYKIVNQIISLFPKKWTVKNKNKFKREFGPTERKKSKNKPEDYYKIFDGNTKEDFKIGIQIKNGEINLYCDFYKSNLIIASPLGLRPVVGNIKNTKGDADFLSSIEILIMDRLDVIALQNTVHLNHVLQCLNHMPKKEHSNQKINYFRVREYALDKKAKYFRQNIYLSSVEYTTLIFSYYMSHCYNHEGHIRSFNTVARPKIEFIYPAMRLCFRIIDSNMPKQEYKDRRAFFTEKVLPEFVKDKSTVQTLIYVPSYFDYVELRHIFREQGLSCFMMCEYTDKGKKAQGRDLFYKGHRHFMLYTERTHFYYRYWIKGIQHLIFYKLPNFPNFFREICNSMMDSHPNRRHEERTCTVIASNRDFLQLKYIVGFEEADRMLKSKNKTFIKYVGS